MMEEVTTRVKPLPLKVQDLTRTQWIIVGASFMMFVGSVCAFVVMCYCASSDKVCVASFGAVGGGALLCSVCAATYVLKHAFITQPPENKV